MYNGTPKKGAAGSKRGLRSGTSKALRKKTYKRMRDEVEVQRVQERIVMLVPVWHLSKEHNRYHRRHLRMTRTYNRMRILKILNGIPYLVYTDIVTILNLLRFWLIMKNCD